MKCPYCGGTVFLVPIYGLLEVKIKRKVKTRLRKLRINEQPTFFCCECYRQFSPSIDEVVELESLVWEDLKFDFDGTK